MYETLGIQSFTAPQAAVIFALALGLAFGVLAERTGFCFRRALVGEDRRAAMGVWLAALAAALLGTQAAVAAGWIGFSDHRFHAADLPVIAVIAGGLLFGAGMVLTRGCLSRLAVLAGGGNLRAVLVLLVAGISAQAAMTGALAPLRVALGSATLPLGEAASLAALPGGAPVWAGLLGAAALAVALGSGNRAGTLALAVALGFLVPAGWVGTGLVLQDAFDPIAQQSLSFTGPIAESLFWTVAATSIPAGFGTGLVAGVLGGGLAAALLFKSFRWQGFEGPAQTGRYLAGAALMGVGGVLAGGCTVGAGLSGIPTLSVAALLALCAIAAGARLTEAALRPLSRSFRASGAPRRTPRPQPAE